MNTAQAIPSGMTAITPYLVCRDATKAIDFYRAAFGASEAFRLPGPDGKLMHAQLTIDGAALMLTDQRPEMGMSSPQSLGGSAVTIHLFVSDVDAAFARAVDAGATVSMPVADMFWGDRYGALVDPFGHCWSIATHVRDLSPDEIAAAMVGACGDGGAR